MSKIKRFIDHQECIGVNGIYFPDGTVYKLDIKGKLNSLGEACYLIKLGGESTIREMEKSDSFYEWNDCAYLFDKSYTNLNITILAGQSDYGSDGFIAVLDAQEKNLIWLAFIDCSDPFYKVSIKSDNTIVAESTNGSRWLFPLKSPEKVKAYPKCEDK